MAQSDGKIFLVQSDNSLIPMDEKPYEVEDRLQRFLEDHSDLLAGDQIDSESPRRFLLVYREIGIPDTQEGGDRWSLDHLFIDQLAVPTFVEAKRSTDPRARREVVAQMLDYAANATHYWPVGKMREQFARRCTALGLNSEEHLAEFLGSEMEIEEFWHRAEENLGTGQVRLLFVADRLPRELQRIIEFLNNQMSLTEVLGVEVRRFVGESAGQQLNTLVPRVIGQTEAAKDKKESRGQSGERLPVLEVEQFLDSLPGQTRDPFRTALEMGQAIGFDLRPYSSAKSQQIQFIVPGVPNPPVYLYSAGRRYSALYVSLGRNHSGLRTSDVNRKLRDMMAAMVPSRRDEVEKKTELGLRAEEIAASEANSELRAVMSLIFNALISQGSDSSPQP